MLPGAQSPELRLCLLSPLAQNVTAEDTRPLFEAVTVLSRFTSRFWAAPGSGLLAAVLGSGRVGFGLRDHAGWLRVVWRALNFADLTAEDKNDPS